MAKKKSPKAVMEEQITSDNDLNFSPALPTDPTTLHSMLEALTHFIAIARTNFQKNADGACSKLIESVNELTTGCEPSSHLPKISAKPGLYIASNFVDKAILSNAVKKLQTASSKVPQRSLGRPERGPVLLDSDQAREHYARGAENDPKYLALRERERCYELTLAPFVQLRKAVAANLSRPNNVDSSTNDWLKQSEVAKRLGKQPWEISRLVQNGELETNGKSRKACRIDPASILEYCNTHGIAWNNS